MKSQQYKRRTLIDDCLREHHRKMFWINVLHASLIFLVGFIITCMVLS